MTFVVVGGGVAGVSVISELHRQLQRHTPSPSGQKIILISPNATLKMATHKDGDANDSDANDNSSLSLLKEVIVDDLTVQEFRKLQRIAVIGNGGIAMEVVHALTSRVNDRLDVDWIVRDKFLGHTLLDATAAAMILPSLENRMRCRDDNVPSNAFIDSSEDVVVSEIVVDGVDTAVEPASKKQKTLEHLQPHGSSLGPYWFDKFRAESRTKGSPFTNARCACHSCRPGFFCMPNGGVEEEVEEKVGEGGRNLKVIYERKVMGFKRKMDEQFVVAGDLNGSEREEALEKIKIVEGNKGKNQILLDSGEILNVDALIIACGVDSNHVLDSVLGASKENFSRGKNGTLKVSKQMKCLGHTDVFAAGDCCDLGEFEKENELFHQMQLWSQAKIEGTYAAHCMLGLDEELMSDFCFEMFAHQTTFLDKRVALLGLFNGQKMGGKLNEFVMTEEGLAKEVSEGGAEIKGLVDPTCEIDMARETPPPEKIESIVSTKKLSEGDIKVLTRVKKNKEYVKCIVSGGRVVGAMLVGEAVDLADTMEQIMMSRINVDALDFDLLDDNIEIDEYFD
ncbi:hypothetical protein TrST_g7666 [Triparma strigata]|uniref:FAD/NAD(P)-binding domain-containing protein n=2 Tax=Triparma strigata TaxID=1606541 RepID=A0A9W7DZM4_9STRA|nr:hypothetical protein TrST_g7666 [Triparma strigata]